MTGSQGHGPREEEEVGSRARGRREGVQESSAVADRQRHRLCCSTVAVLTTQAARVGVSAGCLQALPLGVGAACPAGLLWPGHRSCFCYSALICNTEGSRLARSPLGT